ncbi:hypothetical protein EC396_09680 [Lutibacter sp. HS1-25]|uniref:hypothetical protein n=1 Tax=Lutibacter sp. HS1-25 TaxID=2485000 RepID=UPI001010266A|nr:hypothetical protein [Lutibacter sp. HS1-25]RXP54104.1 hypothetical protein EC396_09680 [Lutibacter sp. HS1-25]
MKKKILFITDWSSRLENGAVLQELLNKNYSENYEWTVWTCKIKENNSFLYRWYSYTKGAFFILKNRKKYDTVVVWQQMIGYLLFEIARISQIKIPNIISYTYLNYHKKCFFGNYKKFLVKHAMSKSKALIWPSMEMCTNAKNDFPKFAYKNYFTVNPMMDIRDLNLPVEKQLDDPYFRNGVYAAGKSDRDFNIVIRAFRNTDIPVTIVCTDKYTITEKNITPNIRILRFSEVDANQYYALALQAFCILNSVTNATSPCGQLLVHFGMENSIPTISTDGYSVKDYIVNNENGVVFNVGKSEEILECYYKLKNDEAFKNKITTNAKKTIKAMSANNFIDKLIHIIEN